VHPLSLDAGQHMLRLELVGVVLHHEEVVGMAIVVDADHAVQVAQGLLDVLPGLLVEVLVNVHSHVYQIDIAHGGVIVATGLNIGV